MVSAVSRSSVSEGRGWREDKIEDTEEEEEEEEELINVDEREEVEEEEG